MSRGKTPTFNGDNDVDQLQQNKDKEQSISPESASMPLLPTRNLRNFRFDIIKNHAPIQLSSPTCPLEWIAVDFNKSRG
jgi:hypothetical protein